MEKKEYLLDEVKMFLDNVSKLSKRDEIDKVIPMLFAFIDNIVYEKDTKEVIEILIESDKVTEKQNTILSFILSDIELEEQKLFLMN